MSVRPLCMFNNPILKQKCEDITEYNEELLVIIQDMEDTMKKNDGIGLAAPQIGVTKRVIIVTDIKSETILPLINPIIIYREGSIEGFEGCLSYPKLNRKIKRPEIIKVKFNLPNGEETEIEAEGLQARIICHEVDHLSGVCKVGNKK